MINNFHLPPSFLHWLSRPPLPWMGDRRAPFKSPSSSLRPPSLVQMGIVAKSQRKGGRLPGSPRFHNCKIFLNKYPSSSPLQVTGGSVGSKMEVTVAERLVWWSLQMRSGEER
ncbi:hypothetical protein NC652_037384 [Populus alba x Populus x berolinensis]|uniref:Uncharacterized protein n=1 Tax=Populus alba x Populus x berolinensis TaxID=444605 RepID=A0AAD6PRW5_9ROSI|nr:hypothetical protein NC652_037384 [Populus alba x Populus x berolinensis]KAJ6958963.1 hypothetical protein NC653_037285 [Populus alba x Populus x berolinensis]